MRRSARPQDSTSAWVRSIIASTEAAQAAGERLGPYRPQHYPLPKGVGVGQDGVSASPATRTISRHDEFYFTDKTMVFQVRDHYLLVFPATPSLTHAGTCGFHDRSGRVLRRSRTVFSVSISTSWQRTLSSSAPCFHYRVELARPAPRWPSKALPTRTRSTSLA